MTSVTSCSCRCSIKATTVVACSSVFTSWSCRADDAAHTLTVLRNHTQCARKFLSGCLTSTAGSSWLISYQGYHQQGQHMAASPWCKVTLHTVAASTIGPPHTVPGSAEQPMACTNAARLGGHSIAPGPMTVRCPRRGNGAAGAACLLTLMSLSLLPKPMKSNATTLQHAKAGRRSCVVGFQG
jgi:hypothetical protein